MHVAFCTLTIGDAYLRLWKASAERGWRLYCERHGYELVVIDKPLDITARARARSPAWQKCLILGSDIAGTFDRVVWVDADILINPAAPPVLDDVPVEKIGAVDESRFPTADAHQRIVKRLAEEWTDENPSVAQNWRSFLNPADWHAYAGLPRRHGHAIQTGVLVMSPRHHRELLEHVYYHYEDVGGEAMNYEMRPLSFEIQERGLQHWIDQRFNALLGFLLLHERIVVKRELATHWEKMTFVRGAFERNYFLHIAGHQELLRDL